MPSQYVYKHILNLAELERTEHSKAAKVDAVDPCVCCSLKTSDELRAVPAMDSVCTRGRRATFCIACINWVRRRCKAQSMHQPQKQHSANDDHDNEFPAAEPPLSAAQAPLSSSVVAGSQASKGVVIPLDNLLQFVDDPGTQREPDKRSMFRLLQNMCIRYTSDACLHRCMVVNPYNRFASPLFHR